MTNRSLFLTGEALEQPIPARTSVTTGGGSAALRAAAALAWRNTAQGWAALNELFRAGTVPDPLPHGRLAGGLASLRIAPGLTQLTNWLVEAWLPWKGKTFDPHTRRGDNVFTRDSYIPAHVLWPFYRGYRDVGPKTYRAFEFCTYTGPGLADPDRQVMKIDYDLGGNPPLSIRRVLDELVQVAPGEYLGKAHLKWWWGRWQTVAFFTLRAEENLTAKGAKGR